MRMTARHFANRAPMPWYSESRSRSPSSPSVTCSSGQPARRLAPVSTLMPGTMPCLESTWTSGVPSERSCRMVSSCMMTPLMKSATPGVVKSISRYARRLWAVEAIPSASNRLVRVAGVSWAARIPFPGAIRARAVPSSSWLIVDPPPRITCCTRQITCQSRAGQVTCQIEARVLSRVRPVEERCGARRPRAPLRWARPVPTARPT